MLLEGLCKGEKTMVKKVVLFKREKGIVNTRTNLSDERNLEWERLKMSSFPVCRGGNDKRHFRLPKWFYFSECTGERKCWKGADIDS